MSEKRYTVENVHGVQVIHDNKNDVHLMMSRAAARLNALEAERDELRKLTANVPVDLRTYTLRAENDDLTSKVQALEAERDKWEETAKNQHISYTQVLAERDELLERELAIHAIYSHWSLTADGTAEDHMRKLGELLHKQRTQALKGGGDETL